MLQARFRPSGRNVGGHAIPLQHHPCTLSGSAWLAVQRFILVVGILAMAAIHAFLVPLVPRSA